MRILFSFFIGALMLSACKKSQPETPSESVKDIDGNTYTTVKICDQTWLRQNLNVSKYTDGTVIPQVTSPTVWANLKTGAWCYNVETTDNGAVYGKLYNWYAVVGIHDAASLTDPSLRKKLAPQGWHVASVDEWTTLITCLGGEAVAGGKLKATGIYDRNTGTGTGLWEAPNPASNSSGFTALPGGYFYTNFPSGGQLHSYAHWWTTNEFDADRASYRGVEDDSEKMLIGEDRKSFFGKSVRCIKD